MDVSLSNLVAYIIIGIAAGWLGSRILKKSSLGLLGNLLVGLIGSFVGGFAFNALGIRLGGDFLGSLVTATVGAIILLWVIGIVRSTSK